LWGNGTLSWLDGSTTTTPQEEYESWYERFGDNLLNNTGALGTAIQKFGSQVKKHITDVTNPILERILGDWSETIYDKPEPGTEDEYEENQKDALDILLDLGDASDTYSNLLAKGDLQKAMKAGETKLLAAVLGGYEGTISSGGHDTAVVSAKGSSLFASGLPLVTDLALGAKLGNTFEKRILLVLDEEPTGAGGAAAASAAATFAPAWSFNADTGKFKWLSAAAEKDYARLATILDANPNPVGLKLVGDKSADKRDFLLGHGGKDTLKSGAGDDVLMGSHGNDVLTGGKGFDVMLGGDGRDRFVFTRKSDSGLTNPDAIFDFTHGKDKIDLSQIDADTKKAGNQAFEMSQLTKQATGTGADRVITLYVDINADGIKDMAIRVFEVPRLYAGDFIL
jgi:hypothetical protein